MWVVNPTAFREIPRDPPLRDIDAIPSRGRMAASLSQETEKARGNGPEPFLALLPRLSAMHGRTSYCILRPAFLPDVLLSVFPRSEFARIPSVRMRRAREGVWIDR
jgi:hypothetical protein